MQAVKTSGFTRGVCKNRGFILNLKVFLWKILREQAILRKSKTPRKSPEKWTFLGEAIYSLHLVYAHCESLADGCMA